MNKKLSRYDLLIPLGFIFALIVGVAAFFYGLQVGKEQTDLKYREFMSQLKQEQDKHQVAYQQEQLVSFYHTVLLPFREFQEVWFEGLDDLETRSEAVDTSSLLKEIGALADKTYAKIEPSTSPEVSPLLVNAHRNYLKSLKLFSEAAGRLKGSAGKGLHAADQIRRDAYVLEAYSFALQAQRQYYDAILEWSKKDNPNVPAIDKLNLSQVTYKEWRKWPLNAKNAFIARMLFEDGTLYPFYPQDVSSNIDDLDATGRAGKLKLATVGQASETLLSTGGVRSGDYIRLKNKVYSNETLPQLPFFFE
jgi:hypothetical protein